MVVGPKKDVQFVDSAIFFLNLFYLMHRQERGVKSTRPFTGALTVRSSR